MPPTNRNFHKNVFINCPFDSECYSLLRPLLFTIAYLGFNPRIAIETSDSGETRDLPRFGIDSMTSHPISTHKGE